MSETRTFGPISEGDAPVSLGRGSSTTESVDPRPGSQRTRRINMVTEAQVDVSYEEQILVIINQRLSLSEMSPEATRKSQAVRDAAKAFAVVMVRNSSFNTDYVMSQIVPELEFILFKFEKHLS